MKRRFYHKIIILMLIAFGLSSCGENPMDHSNPGSISVKTYKYIVPAVGNIKFAPNSNYQQNSVTNWGDWTYIPDGQQGGYTAIKGDTVTISITDSQGNIIPGVQGTVFTQSSMGTVNVKPDGNLYFAPSLYRQNIQAPTARGSNCFSPLDWGVFMTTSSRPCMLSNNETCQQNAGKNTCQQGNKSATCSPINYPVLTPTTSFKLPAGFPSSDPKFPNIPYNPLVVYGSGGQNIPGDYYIFFMDGTTAGQKGNMINSSSSNSLSSSSSSLCVPDFSACADGGASGGIGQPSCIAANFTNGCVLSNGQGLDILTCDDLSGSNCKSIRGPQVMNPFTSYSDYFGDKMVPAPIINGQAEDVIPTPYIGMLANAINSSKQLYSQDQIQSDVNTPQSSPAATGVLKHFKSYSVIFGSDVPTYKLNGDDQSFSGGKYLAFKIDPSLINSANPEAVRNNSDNGYTINYYGYSPKDAITGGATYPYSSGDLLFTFADSNNPPSNINPPRNDCGDGTAPKNGICSYSKVGGSTVITPTPGTTLYLRVADTIAPDNDIDGCYMDNYGYYLVNITVTNKQQVQYGWFEKISSYVINFITIRLKIAVTSFYGSIVTNPDFMNTIRLMVTLYISLYGAYFVLGFAQATATEVVKRVIKIALMFILISPDSYNFFNTYLFGILTQGFIQIAGFAIENSAVTGAMTPEETLSSVFSFVDPAINIFFSPNIWLRMLVALASVYTAFIVPMFVYAMFTYFKVIIEGFIGYLVMLTSIYLMVALFPLFAIFILFDYTRKYFWGWLNYTLNFCLQPIIFLIFLLFMNHLIMVYLNTFVSFDINFGCWMPIFLNISQLVGPLAHYLPTLKVEIFCIPWFLIGRPIEVIVNGLTLLLMVKSVKSMLDFAPVLAERLMSTGFGADSGGNQVQPGAVAGMTGGGEAGLGNKSSLAKAAYEGAAGAVRSLIYDENVSKRLKQGRDEQFTIGGKIDPKRTLNQGATGGSSGGTPGGISGGGGTPGRTPSGTFTPPSLSSANTTTGTTPTPTPASGRTPGGQSNINTNVPTAVGNPDPRGTGSLTNGGKPVPVKDAVAQRIAQNQGGPGFGGGSETPRMIAERENRAKSIFGSKTGEVPGTSGSIVDNVKASPGITTRPVTSGMSTIPVPQTGSPLTPSEGRPITSGRDLSKPVTSKVPKVRMTRPDKLGPESILPAPLAPESTRRPQGPRVSEPIEEALDDNVISGISMHSPRAATIEQAESKLIGYRVGAAPSIEEVKENYSPAVVEAYAAYQQARNSFDPDSETVGLKEFSVKTYRELDKHFDKQMRDKMQELQLSAQEIEGVQQDYDLAQAHERADKLDNLNALKAYHEALAKDLEKLPEIKDKAVTLWDKRNKLTTALKKDYEDNGGGNG